MKLTQVSLLNVKHTAPPLLTMSDSLIGWDFTERKIYAIWSHDDMGHPIPPVYVPAQGLFLLLF